MDEIENIKEALYAADIRIDQCQKCDTWIVIDYFGVHHGICCDKCRRFFCEEHGKETKDRGVFPSKVTRLCKDCE